MAKTSPAQIRAARKWNAAHRDVMRKAITKSNTKRFILKLAEDDDLREVQEWLAKRKENGGK